MDDIGIYLRDDGRWEIRNNTEGTKSEPYELCSDALKAAGIELNG